MIIDGFKNPLAGGDCWELADVIDGVFVDVNFEIPVLGLVVIAVLLALVGLIIADKLTSGVISSIKGVMIIVGVGNISDDELRLIILR